MHSCLMAETRREAECSRHYIVKAIEYAELNLGHWAVVSYARPGPPRNEPEGNVPQLSGFLSRKDMQGCRP